MQKNHWNTVLEYHPIWRTIHIPAVHTTQSGLRAFKANNTKHLCIQVPHTLQQEQWFQTMEEVQNSMIDYINRVNSTDYGLRIFLYPYHPIPTITLKCTPFTKYTDASGNTLDASPGLFSNSNVDIVATCAGVWVDYSLCRNGMYEVHWDIVEVKHNRTMAQHATNDLLHMPYQRTSNRLHEYAHLLQCRWRWILHKRHTRRVKAAIAIQRYWRKVSNSPYTHVGKRCIMHRFHEMMAQN